MLMRVHMQKFQNNLDRRGKMAKLQFLLTVETNWEVYEKLKDKGYGDYQIQNNIRRNLEGIFAALMAKWYCAIDNISIEELDQKKSQELATLCQNGG
jgi:hypothetical protein